MKTEEKSKYRLMLLHLPTTKSAELCSKEVAALQAEYLLLDNLFSVGADLPLVRELINSRFRDLNDRQSEINAGKICNINS
jgi:hypothetical protein